MSDLLCPIRRSALICPQYAAIKTETETITYSDLELFIESDIAFLKNTKTLAIHHPSDVRLIPLIFAAFRLQIPVFILNTYLPQPGQYISQIKPDLLITPDNIPPLAKASTIQSDAIYDSKQTATYLLTSGTSSLPKIAMHSLGNHYFSAQSVLQKIPLESEDRWLLSLPLYHVGGLAILFRTFMRGAAVVQQKNLHNITHVSWVSTQLYRFLQTHQSQSLKCLLLGGGPMSKNLYQNALSKKLPLYLSYGMTEASSQILTAFQPEWSDKLYLGSPLSHFELKIKDRELHIRGTSLFQGYFPNKTNDDWFATGDLAEYHPEKGYTILGRKDNLFISGGENIQPEEIETALLDVPGISQAVVFPKEDSEFGNRPIAYIDAKHIHSEAILEALRKKLPGYKVPIEFHDLKPFLTSGLKPPRKLLLETVNN